MPKYVNWDLNGCAIVHSTMLWFRAEGSYQGIIYGTKKKCYYFRLKLIPSTYSVIVLGRLDFEGRVWFVSIFFISIDNRYRINRLLINKTKNWTSVVCSLISFHIVLRARPWNIAYANKFWEYKKNWTITLLKTCATARNNNLKKN
jgi:hypothetical protein